MAVPAQKEAGVRDLKPYLVCLSLANLIFVKPWTAMYRIRIEEPSAVSTPAFAALLEATVIDVLIAFVIFASLVYLVRRSKRPGLHTFGMCVFLFICTFPIERLCWVAFDRLQSTPVAPVMKLVWGLLLAVPLLGCVLLVVYSNRVIARAAINALLITVPLLPLNAGNMLWSMLNARSASRPKLAQPAPGTPDRRLVWIIFDELDYRLAFQSRPPGINLPELDRLRSESLHATAAVSPAPNTEESMPALITGKLSTKASELAQVRTVFTDMRERGLNSGVVGWYIPYCRAMSQDVVDCVQPTADVLLSSDLATVIGQQWSDRLGQNWIITRFTKYGRNMVPWFGWAERQQQKLGFVYMREQALKLVADPRLGFVFFHFPIPHPLGIYNRHTGEIVADPQSNYIDNLLLVDRTLGELRQALAAANLEENTDLIVSSDHPLRVNAWIKSEVWDQEEARDTGNQMAKFVPFLVHLPADANAAEYPKPMNTIVSKNLAAALVRGSLRTNADVARWLDVATHGSRLTTAKSGGGVSLER